MAAAWQRWVGRVASALRSLGRRPPPADAAATSTDTAPAPRRWRTWHLAVAAGVAALLAAVSAAALWWFGAPRATAPEVRATQTTRQASAPSAAAPARAGSAAAGAAPSAGVVTAPSGAPSTPIGAIVPDIRPRLAGAVPRTAPAQFALVGPPITSEAEAREMLARLREAASRIRHPTATETSIDRTPDGWRVAWWPFNGERQAENARSALAARRIALEVVEF